MQIILNQADIEEAIKADLLDRFHIGSDDDQEITIELSDNEAIITIGDHDDQPEKTEKSTEPKPKRAKRRTKAQMAAAAEAAEESTDSNEPEAETPLVDNVDEVEEVDPEPETDTDVGAPIKRTPEAKTPDTDVDEPVKPTALKIFPDIGSSAAPSAPEKEKDPVQAAKSLFANLNTDAA